MTSAVIVQARMTSTRLPGKILEPVAGATILHHVLSRCAQIPGMDVVCCAVPDGELHDPVVREAQASGAVVVRGSEQDVLDRYHKAARELRADTIMRVTSDCPLIDPGVCGMVAAALKNDKTADYAANNFSHRFPHGLDCEAFTWAALDQAWKTATEQPDREHVTPWLRRETGIHRVSVDGPDEALGRLRWTVDYPEDLTFCRALFARFDRPIPSWQEVLRICETSPELAAINASRQQR